MKLIQWDPENEDHPINVILTALTVIGEGQPMALTEIEQAENVARKALDYAKDNLDGFELIPRNQIDE